MNLHMRLNSAERIPRALTSMSGNNDDRRAHRRGYGLVETLTTEVVANEFDVSILGDVHSA
jgi:hypothetical protein